MADVIEIDAATGSVVERAFTAEELAQREADQAAHDAAEAARIEAEADAAAARDAAIAKLAVLGLTVDDLSALGLG